MELFPGLPNHVALECLIRIPFDQFPIQLPEFRRHRKTAGLARSLIVVSNSQVNPTRNRHTTKLPDPLLYRLALCDPETGSWSELPPLDRSWY
ncbi:hypothetical protein CsSME_00007424 [Camellia sinensis var. sinensis]